MSAQKFFSSDENEAMVAAIREAELDTSGEIRVHIETNCREDVLDRAAWVFKKLGMHKTALRNGVLLYVALSDRKLAIIGDSGINQKVSDDFWDSTRDKMLLHFKSGKIAEGICEAVISAGHQLKTHFPHKSDDINELPDDISFGN